MHARHIQTTVPGHAATTALCGTVNSGRPARSRQAGDGAGRQVVRWRSLGTVVACCVLFGVLVTLRPPAGGVHAASRQATDLALSPEEAVIAIKPLQLTPDDLPAGFLRGVTSVDTPVSDALRKAAAGADPYAALSQSTAEGTQACSVQRLTPPTGAAVTTATLNICLMSDTASAQNVVQGLARAIDPGTGTLTAERAAPDLVVGDTPPTVWRLIGTDSSGTQGTDFLVRWSRGPVAFEVRSHARTDVQDATATASLSKTIDAGEASRMPVTLPTPTTAAPVSEVQRLYSTLNAQTAIVPMAQPPIPTSRLNSYLIQLPAEAVLNAPNPAATLRQLDGTFRRVVYVNEVFNDAARALDFGQRVTVDADAAGALAELQNPNSDGFFSQTDASGQPLPNGAQTDTELAPPVQLGDGTRAFKTLIAYPDTRNNVVTYTLRWTHGPIVLQARIGAFERTNQPLADIVPWVQRVDAAYAASALATMTRVLFPSAPSQRRAAAAGAGVRSGGVLALVGPPPTSGRWRKFTLTAIGRIRLAC